MALAGEGIWVRLTLEDGSVLRGYAPGAESPNDFWSKFRTQLVRIEDAEVERGPATKDTPALYVNRDRIVIAEVVRRER